MPKATAATITPRAEPEVLAAQVSAMLAPFFNRKDLGPAPVLREPIVNRPAPAAARELVLA